MITRQVDAMERLGKYVSAEGWNLIFRGMGVLNEKGKFLGEGDLLPALTEDDGEIRDQFVMRLVGLYTTSEKPPEEFIGGGEVLASLSLWRFSESDAAEVYFQAAKKEAADPEGEEWEKGKVTTVKLMGGASESIGFLYVQSWVEDPEDQVFTFLYKRGAWVMSLDSGAPAGLKDLKRLWEGMVTDFLPVLTGADD